MPMRPRLSRRCSVSRICCWSVDLINAMLSRFTHFALAQERQREHASLFAQIQELVAQKRQISQDIEEDKVRCILLASRI